jgi:hypothetical protein
MMVDVMDAWMMDGWPGWSALFLSGTGCKHNAGNSKKTTTTPSTVLLECGATVAVPCDVMP